MAQPALLTALRDHLIDLGIVRDPTVDGVLPPFWREPRDGTPAPGEGKTAVEIGPDLVVGAYLTGGVPRSAFDTSRKRIVDVRFRGRTVPVIEAADEAITAAIAGDGDGRFDWTMAGLYLVESRQWRPLQRLGSGPEGYEFVSAFWFETLLP